MIITVLPENAIVVNQDDIDDCAWPTIYCIRLGTGMVWLSDPFIVAADSEQDALDEVADYCVEHFPGYVQHGIDDDNEYFDEEYIAAGNGDTYLNSIDTTIDVVARRDRGAMKRYHAVGEFAL